MEDDVMQITLDIPDDLAARLEPMQDQVAEIIERGLRQRWSEVGGLRREVIAFLARGPRPEEILRFRPSDRLRERTRELLERSKQGRLSPADEAELDELSKWICSSR
jgi:hypothetical protein